MTRDMKSEVAAAITLLSIGTGVLSVVAAVVERVMYGLNSTEVKFLVVAVVAGAIAVVANTQVK